jgi:hypothetical protein
MVTSINKGLSLQDAIAEMQEFLCWTLLRMQLNMLQELLQNILIIANEFNGTVNVQ